MIFSYKILIIAIFSLYSCEDFFLSKLDECGVPDGDNSSCEDECGIPNGLGIPNGECDCNNNIMGCNEECGSNQVFDICGVCNGGETIEHNCECDNPLESRDCFGECGGMAIIDQCGICNGNNSSCTGCMIIGSDNYSANNIISDNNTCFVDYNSTIQPIFNNHCTDCHGSSGGLDLSSFQSLMLGGNHGPTVVQNDANGSILIQKINPNPTFGDQMGNLSETTINKISTWIDLGALENN